MKANALLTAIKKSDVRKYLPATRTDPSDWKTGKSVDEITKIKAAGGFVDLIQWRAHRSHAVGMADDGYVLEFRNSDAGKDMFGSNADAKTHAPQFMWDEKKVGYKSITADQLRKGDHFLIREQNAVPFDPNAGWKEGDLIPDYVISRQDAQGSAADNNAIASWKDGMWTVVVIRPLGPHQRRRQGPQGGRRLQRGLRGARRQHHHPRPPRLVRQDTGIRRQSRHSGCQAALIPAVIWPLSSALAALIFSVIYGDSIPPAPSGRGQVSHG